MATLVMVHKDTDEAIHIQGYLVAEQFAGIGEHVCALRGLSLDDYLLLSVAQDLTPSKFSRGFEVIAGAIQRKAKSLAEAQRDKIKIVKRHYEKVCAGTDPRTGKSIYIDCTVGETTYRMNAGEKAAQTLFFGFEKAERRGSATLPKLRDFYNVNHLQVPIADAEEIMLQQGEYADSLWEEKCNMVDAIGAATTVEELEAVNTVFSVNVAT